MAIDLKNARFNIGQKVVYRPRGGTPEKGRITSVNDAYVFVRYEGDDASKATSPEDLEYA